MLTKHSITVVKLATLLLCSQSAMANSFSFTGNFTYDNDVQLFNFSLASDSTALTIHTLSLLGATNAAGNLISGGGFNPYLAIFDESGALIKDTSGKNESEESIIANYGTLLAGTYTLALTQFDNIAVGTYLSEGFADDYVLASFDPTPFTTMGGGGSSHWAVDILTADTATSVPAPEALTLTLLGLIGYGAKTRVKFNIKTGLSA
ncbi:DVUA0089 family protein [Crenothrix sp.]|uniref:DVUA0089 family protein n=1 Tax=Crenothrix sp. TaxID=3100433 RepID=UPI00374D996A